LILTGYRSGEDVGCGTDSDGAHLMQHSSRSCAAAGMSADQILQLYFGPGLAIGKPPAQPAAVFESPGFGETLTATASATAAWSEETAAGASITGRSVALQMAAPINGSCLVDRWLPSTPPWTSTGASPQTATGLRSGYCYRFVVGLTGSGGTTTHSASSAMLVDPLAPVATFTNPATGTLTAITDPSTTIQWTEASAPGTGIEWRKLQREYAAQTAPGSCAGAQWIVGDTSWTVSGMDSGTLAHFFCYRWRMTLSDSAGHAGTWLSGVLVEPAA